eukprot:TRINITY_DN23305_c0_g1_i1.p1 TRINITY_DN23305_c0_g1~~TRINITY_DN23305_c0_g1_i1.p1  ORF type:complete len:730 (+),score=156.55 TRINITY_DN23305_c0_g1_i1:218-2191(+)
MCHHCYEKHWDSVVQEATETKDRQRRLGLLSAVPMDRRRQKDYEAAFGTRRDSRMFLPRSPGSSPERGRSRSPGGTSPKAKDRLEAFEAAAAEELKESPQLVCEQGHPVIKRKMPKPWQDVMQSVKPCNECGESIGRDQFRWRCLHHCNFNVCEGCYDSHWGQVFAMVHRTRDERKCWELLGAVPLELRDREDFLAAQARVARRAAREAAASSKKREEAITAAAISAYGTEAGPQDVKGKIKGAAVQMENRLQGLPQLEAFVWAMLLVLVDCPVNGLIRQLEGPTTSLDEQPELPEPFLMQGLSMILGALLLQAVLWGLRRLRKRPAELPAPPRPPPGLSIFRGRVAERRRSRRWRRRRTRDLAQQVEATEETAEWTVYAVLGVMLGFEMGTIAVLRRRSPLAAESELLGFAPLFMLLAGHFSATEQLRKGGLVLAVALASVGGFFVTPGGWQQPWAELSTLPLMLFAQAVGMMRWVFTNNILPPCESTPSSRFAALLVLASNMAMPCGACCLELAAFTDLRGYMQIFRLRRPLWNLALLAALGICQAIALFASLNLVRITSLPLLGLLPCISAAAFLPLRAGFSELPAVGLLNWLGMLLCIAAAGCYYRARTCEDAETEDMDSAIGDESASEYQRLSDGGESEDDGSASPASNDAA